MQDVADKHNLPLEIKAFPDPKLDTIYEQYHPDVILLGPQVKFKFNAVHEKYDPLGVPVDVINLEDYGNADGERILKRAIQLLKGGDEDAHIEAKNSLMGAIWTIIVADAMMSIDNVIGVVGAAKGHLELVIVGMLITVPIIVFCSTLFARIINKFPVILWAGGALLGWVAGEMIVEDPLLMPYIQGEELLVKIGTVFFVLIVTGMIKIWKKRDA